MTADSVTAEVVPLLTPTQRQILEFIRGFFAVHRYPPTIREIGDGVHLSPSAIHYQVGQLLEKGWIRRVPGLPRTIEVLDPATGGE
ncbi:MarR family transcriptional regulator [Actinoplanes sp. NPDC023936]|uniref:LexA family protein n=1 Tax=Actinoplanes sp. NPDC023936 TaxID=3154910 RepID=UPI003403EF63